MSEKEPITNSILTLTIWASFFVTGWIVIASQNQLEPWTRTEILFISGNLGITAAGLSFLFIEWFTTKPVEELEF